MLTFRSLFGLAGALCLVVPAHALETLQSGEWQITGARERNGVVTDRPPITRCLTAEQARDIPRRPAENAGPASCQPTDYKEGGKSASWRMHCTGPLTLDTAANYTVPDPRHYSAKFTTTVTVGGKASSSTLTIQGTLLGECRK